MGNYNFWNHSNEFNLSCNPKEAEHFKVVLLIIGNYNQEINILKIIFICSSLFYAFWGEEKHNTIEYKERRTKFIKYFS